MGLQIDGCAGPVNESLSLLGGADAPGEARRFVRRLATAGEQRDALELLVSELVTNAVSYAHPGAELTLHEIGDRIRVEVSDASPCLPAFGEPKPEGGWGLRLVDALADRWGVDGRVDGKTVWFEISDHEAVPTNRTMARPEAVAVEPPAREHLADRDRSRSPVRNMHARG